MSRRSNWLWLVAILGYLFLYAPLAIVVVYSFNASRLNAQWVGFTLDWYRKLFHNEEMLGAPALSPPCWAPWLDTRCTASSCVCCRS
jgi:spermidine/putrescine transport system permease protein